MMETTKTIKELKTNVIYRGDCLQIMKSMPDNSVDLIYLDPPFQSNTNYEGLWKSDKRIKFNFSDMNWSNQAKDINPLILKKWVTVEEEKDKEEDEHYNMRWKNNNKGARNKIKELQCYCAYMEERILECRRILKKSGSLYLHCDWHAGHYLKIMMDRVFGYENFRNEIVWCYDGPSSPKMTVFARKHDTIFRYSKTDKYTWNVSEVKDEYAETSISAFKSASKLGGERTKYINQGKYPNDWWMIPSLKNTSERLGYPTQKPEKLLERIIRASSNPGDIVLDPFCGCGTAIAVAQRLGRKFIGMDLSHRACWVMQKRLGYINSGKLVEVIGGVRTLQEYKDMNHHDFADEMIINYGGTPNQKKSGDKGIDGWTNPLYTGERIPIQVKQWGHNVGVPCIDGFQSAIRRDKKTSGIIIAFGFSKSCFDEVEKIKKDYGIDIKLIEANTLLNLQK